MYWLHQALRLAALAALDPWTMMAAGDGQWHDRHRTIAATHDAMTWRRIERGWDITHDTIYVSYISILGTDLFSGHPRVSARDWLTLLHSCAIMYEARRTGFFIHDPSKTPYGYSRPHSWNSDL